MITGKAAKSGVLLCVVLASHMAHARTFEVGPKKEYRTISEVSAALEPGDVVQVTGDVRDRITLTRHGTTRAPIIIRAAHGKGTIGIARPRLLPEISSRDATSCILMCEGDNYVIEGLEFSASQVPARIRLSAVEVRGSNTVIRDCYFHHFNGRAIQSYVGAGDIDVEFCEFDSNGSTGSEIEHRQTIDLFSDVPGARATVQHCFFHNGTGGNFFKSRYCRNVIRYNWFESPYLNCLSIIDSVTEVNTEARAKLYPMHSDIVANVFLQGWSPRIPWSVMRVGGEDEAAAGTEGDFNIAHNLFLMTCGGMDPAPALAVTGNVERIRLYNNVFVDYGIAVFKVYWRARTWEGERTRLFVARRGSGEPVIEGSGNWISDKATSIPEGLTSSIRGINPLFENLVHYDFRPHSNSPLLTGGCHSLPKGALVDLVPEYEPVRGIPADLKPKVRRRAERPAIGPFEGMN